jgi:hypothetical protein
MWTLARITLVALGLCFIAGGQASAGDAGLNGVQNQQIQLASALGGTEQSSLVANQGGAVFPVNNGNGRWICTPSGFGHLATCSLRSGN